MLLFAFLIIAAGASAWVLNYLSQEIPVQQAEVYHDPDYYMEDFTTLSLQRKNGEPKNKLHAVYMAHYPDDDTTEMLQPKMEIYRVGRPPLFLTAKQGWVASDNNVILLQGGVRLWEDNEFGERTLQVDTPSVRVLMDDQYAETDQPTTIYSNHSTVKGSHIRAYMKDSRVVVLKHEHTTIEHAQHTDAAAPR